MTCTIGIDPSLTATGVVVLGSDGTVIQHSEVASVDLGLSVQARMKRIEKLTRGVMAIVAQVKPACACIETYSFGSSSSMITQLAEYGGVLRFALIDYGVKLHEVAPTTLKKWATGAGKFPKGSGKTPMIVHITQKYGEGFNNDNEYDAYALARIAMQIAGFEPPANEAQKQCIATITAPKVRNTKKKVSR